MDKETKKEISTIVIDALESVMMPVFDKVFERFDEHDKRFDKIEKKLSDHDKRFDAHDKRFNDHDNKFDSLEKRICSKIEYEVAKIREELNDLKREIKAVTKMLEEDMEVSNKSIKKLEIKIIKIEKRMDILELSQSKH